MISQALIVQDKQILMVQQYVERGDVVWNFPGGGIENGETPEQACIREVKEETGYDIRIRKLLLKQFKKYTYIAEVIDGYLYLDTENAANDDIIDVAWVALHDNEKFDSVTMPLIRLLDELSEAD